MQSTIAASISNPVDAAVHFIAAKVYDMSALIAVAE